MWSKTELLSKSSSIFFIGIYYPSNLLRIWTDFTKEPCNLVLGTCILVNLFWRTLFSWIAAVWKLEWWHLKMTLFQQERGGRALSNSAFKTSYSHDYFSVVSFNVLLLLLQAGFELECKKQSCSFHKRWQDRLIGQGAFVQHRIAVLLPYTVISQGRQGKSCTP